MFADDADSNIIQQAIEAGVSAYVVDGLADKRIKPLLEVAIARFRKHQSLKDELSRIKTSLEERKLIERAKGLLMKSKGCDEQQSAAGGCGAQPDRLDRTTRLTGYHPLSLNCPILLHQRSLMLHHEAVSAGQPLTRPSQSNTNTH